MDNKQHSQEDNDFETLPPSYAASNSSTLYDLKRDSPPPYKPADTIESPPPPYCFKPKEADDSPRVVYTRQTESIIISSQPSPPAVSTNVGINGDYYLTVSVILTILCLFSCGYIWLFCTIPAFLLSSKALQANTSGDMRKARNYGQISLCLNAFAIISWIIFWAIVVIIASSSSRNSISRTSYDNSYHYNHYYYK